jgi:hypothetical protein
MQCYWLPCSFSEAKCEACAMQHPVAPSPSVSLRQYLIYRAHYLRISSKMRRGLELACSLHSVAQSILYYAQWTFKLTTLMHARRPGPARPWTNFGGAPSITSFRGASSLFATVFRVGKHIEVFGPTSAHAYTLHNYHVTIVRYSQSVNSLDVNDAGCHIIDLLRQTQHSAGCQVGTHTGFENARRLHPFSRVTIVALGSAKTTL